MDHQAEEKTTEKEDTVASEKGGASHPEEHPAGDNEKKGRLPAIKGARAISAPASDGEAQRRPIHKTRDEVRWDREYTILRERCDKARPMIDCEPPRFLLRTMLNQKKYQVEQAKAKWIERENKQLLERIGRILQTRGQVDHRNETYERLKRNERILGNPYRNQRHAELVRITMENQHFLRLLMSVGPRLPTHELMRDWEKNCRTMAFTSKRDPDKYKELGKDAQKASQVHKQRLMGFPRLESQPDVQ